MNKKFHSPKQGLHNLTKLKKKLIKIVSSNANNRICFHKKESLDGQLMFIFRKKGEKYAETNKAYSVWFILEGIIRFYVNKKQYILKHNDFFFLKPGKSYKNIALKNSIIFEFKSKRQIK
jgi:mannose-6-phosphate isomerase-like protein (cupin superfamily)